MLTKEAIEEFKKIYQEEFNQKIDDKTALELGVNLLTFLKYIYRPVKKEWLKEYEGKLKNNGTRNNPKS